MSRVNCAEITDDRYVHDTSLAAYMEEIQSFPISLYESPGLRAVEYSMGNTHVEYMRSFVEILSLLWLQIQSRTLADVAVCRSMIRSMSTEGTPIPRMAFQSAFLSTESNAAFKSTNATCNGLVHFSKFQNLKSEFSLTLLEIDQDNLRTKLKWCCRAFYEH